MFRYKRLEALEGVEKNLGFKAPLFGIGFYFYFSGDVRKRIKENPSLRDHALDVKVGEDDLDPLSDKGVEEIVALGIPRVESRKVGTPKGSVRRYRAIEPKTTGHRRDLLSRRYPEICCPKERRGLSNLSIKLFIRPV